MALKLIDGSCSAHAGGHNFFLFFIIDLVVVGHNETMSELQPLPHERGQKLAVALNQ